MILGASTIHHLMVVWCHVELWNTMPAWTGKQTRLSSKLIEIFVHSRSVCSSKAPAIRHQHFRSSFRVCCSFVIEEIIKKQPSQGRLWELASGSLDSHETAWECDAYKSASYYQCCWLTLILIIALMLLCEKLFACIWIYVCSIPTNQKPWICGSRVCVNVLCVTRLWKPKHSMAATAPHQQLN